MPDREQVAREIEQLKQASVKALDENDFLRAVQLSQARKQLESWLSSGLAGPAPVDAAALLTRRAPAATPCTSFSMAAGWSPWGENSELSLKPVIFREDSNRQEHQAR